MFAKTGARVFFTSRDAAKGEKVRNEILEELQSDGTAKEPKVEMLQMDLQNLESVRSAAKEFKLKSDKLNVLVNNAGKHAPSSTLSPGA